MGITPPGQKFTVNVPRGTVDTFRENYAHVPKDQRVRFVYHKVKRKETLNSVAHRYGISKTRIAKANGLSTRTNTLRSGTLLMIPKKGVPPKLKTAPQVVPQEAPQEEEVLLRSAYKSDTPVRMKRAEEYHPNMRDSVVASVPTDVVEVFPLTHRVKKGETLSLIARKYGVTVASLKALNGLGKKGIIKSGHTLKISEPFEETPTTADEKTGEKKLPSAEELLAEQESIESQKEAEATVATPPPVAEKKSRYVVQNGDSLWSIAQATGVTVSDLVRLNPPLAAGETIKPNQSIRVSAKAEASKPPAVRASEKNSAAAAVAVKQPSDIQSMIVHKVRRGDTLYGLARKYGVTVAQIKNWNRLNRDTLLLNQKIKIHAQTPSASAKKVAFAE